MTSRSCDLSDYKNVSDESLTEAVKRGENGAFQALMLRYARHIFNFARQYAKTDEDAEDIAQDSFFKVWKHMKKYYDYGKNFIIWFLVD